MADTKPAAEPWMRGTHGELPSVPRAVVHSFEQAQEDLQHWCGHLTDNEWNLKPQGLSSAASQLQHIIGSTDRLLTYAEGNQLTAEQLSQMKEEANSVARSSEALAEFTAAMQKAEQRVRALAGADLETPRTIGRRALPTTLGGLLVHVAEHTTRHVGQLILTAKLAVNTRGGF